MSSPEVYLAVRELLTAALPDIPIVWPNEGDVTDTSMPWVYCEVVGSVLRRIELGIGFAEERGTVWCHVYVPLGTGTLEARTIAKRLSTAFRQARDSPVTYGDQSIGAGEPGDDDGMLWRLSLTTDYQFQDR